ncbi:MAG TPA: nitrilase-related carbon-nitrogen hydrolase [Fimbriimonadaceae bacterium]|nr:nitrilase-related carbon-nitrogen hydrolase [Fimbriimonadaceae bacterium]
MARGQQNEPQGRYVIRLLPFMVNLKSAAVWAGAIALSAVLFVYSLPPANLGFLGLFALVPILKVVRGRGFLVGFVTSLAMVFAAAKLAESGWASKLTWDGGTLGWLYTGFGLFGFAISLTVAVYADVSRRREPSMVTIAGLAVLFEACLLLVLPAHLALTQYEHPFAMTVASIGGVWLVSWLLWVLQLKLASLTWPRSILACALLAGCWLITAGLQFKVGGSTAQVGMVQTEAIDLETLSHLHKWTGKNQVAIWPEFSALAIAHEGDTTDLRKLSLESSPIITTFRDAAKPLPHNVAAMFSDGNESAPYFKRKLFGSEREMHAAGVQSTQVSWRFGIIGLNICYDSCFPGIIRDTASNPAVNLIALPTIDPPSPHHFIAAIHAAYTTFRCAENGVSIVRVDGAAYSMAVDGRGHIVTRIHPGERATSTPVPTERIKTVYALLGDWVLYLAPVSILIAALEAKKPHPKAGLKLYETSR